MISNKYNINNNYIEGNFLSFGSLDLSFLLYLNKEDIINNNISWNNINSLKDLKFLISNKSLYKRIDLSSNINTLQLLIQMNKITPNKIKIKHICYNSLNYEETEKELIDFIYDVTIENGLYLDSCEICPCKIKIELKLCYENEWKNFILLGDPKSNFLISNINHKLENSSKINDNPFSYISEGIVDNNNYNYIYFDLSDYTTGEFKSKISIHNLYEFCTYLKLKTKSKLIINIKNEIHKTEEFRNLLSIFDVCICYSKNNLFENLKILKYNEDKKKQKEEMLSHYYATINKDKEEEIKEQQEKGYKKKHNIIIKKLLLNKIIDTNDNKSIGSRRTTKTTLSQGNNNKIKIKKLKPMPPKYLDKLNMFTFYKKGICDKDPINKNNKKILIVFDKFNKVYFIQCLKNENKPFILDFDIKLYPKINIHNISTISENKQFINSKFNEYIIIFIGCLLNIMASKGKDGCDEKNLFLGYLIAVNYLKKISELEKNNISLPIDKNFYYFNINKKEYEKLTEYAQKRKQENLFILDCNNKNTDKIRQYNPLLDKYLSRFFSSKKNKQILKTKGFIDDNDKLLYDPIYRDSFGNSPKQVRNIKFEEYCSDRLSYNSSGNSLNKKNIKIELNKYITGHGKKMPYYYIYKDKTKKEKLLPLIRNSSLKSFSSNKNNNICNKENKIYNLKQKENCLFKSKLISSLLNKIK